MKWKVSPSRLAGEINIPPSKSHTIRALLIAALARGESRIMNPLLSGDGLSALGAAVALGAAASRSGGDLLIHGIADDYNSGEEFFNMGNSGTGTNLFMAAAALGSKQRRFDGDFSLRSRPFRPLLESLEQLGARYTIESTTGGDLPFTICGPLRGGRTTVNGISSQFLSSLLFACPLLDYDTEIIVEDLHERPYVEMTLWWLKKQGIAVKRSADWSVFHVKGGQSYSPFAMEIPADFSGAAFAACAAAMGDQPIALRGLDFSDPQGDKGIFEVLGKMGASISPQAGSVGVIARQGLHGQVIDLNAMPDALPALSVAACSAAGETRFVNVAQARIKETDRIAVMREELAKMGATVSENPDGLTVKQSRLTGAQVDGHGDHRVVMALALAGFVAEGETVIDTAEAAAVTYPSFVDDFRKLGANIEIIPD